MTSLSGRGPGYGLVIDMIFLDVCLCVDVEWMLSLKRSKDQAVHVESFKCERERERERERARESKREQERARESKWTGECRTLYRVIQNYLYSDHTVTAN